MAALRSLVGILAPLQLGFLLPVRVLAEGSFERIGSPIDFSVSLSNMRPEDSGTYRCSMIKEGPHGGERTPKKLTVVSVVEEMIGEEQETEVAPDVSPAGIGMASLTILGPSQLLFFLLKKQKLFSISAVGGPGLSTEPRIPEFTFTQITAGQTLVLNCTLTQMDLPASAKWYKDLGNGQKLIYRERDKFSRGARLVPGSKTDFSISLSNVGYDDNGTYYCSVVKKSLEKRESTVKKQVVVFVTVPPKVRLETSPPSPVQLNATVTVTCHAESFYPDGAKVDLFCKNTSGKGKTTATTLNSDGTYSRNSSMKFTATEKWNSSLFTCLVKHNSQAAIKATARLFIRTESSRQQSMLGLYLGLFLNKI
ncbi:tyrosine-protein phosphatase non-receptor type substrate 1-like [Crotalus adamanteus]|uniref:Tyrosine-protein phosphatase non-receptor type substrate 1-like n=1 Tax=Crotalus adamanteus TaxID=8729 RepID=A0AAW1BS49_CROAD